jgi:trimeric autotransporter adhesin
MRPFRFHQSLTGLACILILLVTAQNLVAAETANALEEERTLPGSTLVVDRVVMDPATGNPQIIALAGDRPEPEGDTTIAKALNLLESHAKAVGLTDPARELQPVGVRKDPIGGAQAIFRQMYRGVPVFGSRIRVHLDADGRVSMVNGTLISDIDLDTVPRLDAHVAEAAGVALVAKQNHHPAEQLEVHPATLMIFREGLVRGVPGANHLAWEVEVASPPDLHEVLFLDAHDGRLLDQRSKIHHIQRVIHRRSYPRPIWSEGDALPFDSGDPAGDAEINELIAATGDAYSLFANITNGQYLSFDGLDTAMNSVYDSDSIECPNAVESGGITAFCQGMVSDDVAAHEWAHAYTDWTHGLIYQWQPGALNEAYSDIFGELVDQLNGRGTDFPAETRPSYDCSAVGGNPVPTLEVTDPSSIAGLFAANGAVFNPSAPWTVSGLVELANDGTGDPSDACEDLGGFTPGSIALVNRGSCLFREKVVIAQSAGATAVIVVNNVGNDVIEMGGDLPRLTIPAVFIGQSDGDRIKAALGDGVAATLSLDGEFTDSVRWLIGEDTQALGSIRDMWSPSCFGDPGRVGSVNYYCREDDNGGVHTNSGIPNHAFALLVDGGLYNGFEVGAIGPTKAARIYWRAMAIYQTPVTDFRNHADLLETSCRDLIGEQLYDVETGAPSAELITSADCAKVAAAVAAVEMRVVPEQCHFQPMLDPDAPEVDANVIVFDEDFNTEPDDGWTLSNYGVFSEYEPRDWEWTEDLPTGSDGGAFFAIDSVLVGNCLPGSDDQSGVMELTSPTIEIPRGTTSPVLSFDHWVATEATWDGGNLKISVNGSAFTQVSTSHFDFNPYNRRLQSGNSNPMKGQLAFSGTDAGSLSGSWGESQIDLDSLVQAGDQVVLRFDFGVDGCNGAWGWYVDNVRVVATGSEPRRPGGRVRP